MPPGCRELSFFARAACTGSARSRTSVIRFSRVTLHAGTKSRASRSTPIIATRKIPRCSPVGVLPSWHCSQASSFRCCQLVVGDTYTHTFPRGMIRRRRFLTIYDRSRCPKELVVNHPSFHRTLRCQDTTVRPNFGNLLSTTSLIVRRATTGALIGRPVSVLVFGIGEERSLKLGFQRGCEFWMLLVDRVWCRSVPLTLLGLLGASSDSIPVWECCAKRERSTV